MAALWKRRSVLKSCAISRTRRWKGNFLISNSVDFWYLLISRRATVPGLKNWNFIVNALYFQYSSVATHSIYIAQLSHIKILNVRSYLIIISNIIINKPLIYYSSFANQLIISMFLFIKFKNQPKLVCKSRRISIKLTYHRELG